MGIAQRLIKIREYKGLSPEKLGTLCGFSARSWRYYEESEEKASNILAAKMVKIVNVCNVDIAWLLTGQGDMVPGQNEKPPAQTCGPFPHVIENHIDIVKRFRNHDMAKQINEQLLELEALDEGLFEDVGVHVNATLEAARKLLKKGHCAERRSSDQPYKGPNKRKAG